MSFYPASFLEEALSKKDLLNVRVALSSYISKSPGDTKEIRDALRYAREKSNNLEIMEEHNGEEFEGNKENWNDNYFALIQTKLIDNFSNERFLHIVDVGAYLYPKKQHPQEKAKQTLSDKQNMQRSTVCKQGKRVLPNTQKPNKSKMDILNMLGEKKISAEEAYTLIDNLNM